MRRTFHYRLSAGLSLLASTSLILGGCLSAPTTVPATPIQATAAATTVAVSASETPAATVAATTEPPVELTYYFPGDAQADLQAVQDAMNVILQKKINATIRLMQIDWGAYNDKMNLLFSSQEDCDLVYTAPWINNYFQAVNNESLKPLDDLLPQYAPELWASLDQGAWDATRVRGLIYGVPSPQIWVKTWGFAVRQDLAEKYHFDWAAAEKWADLTPLLASIKQGEPDMTVWDAAPGLRSEFWGWDPIDEGIGGALGSAIVVRADDPELKAFNEIETPEFKAYVELVRQWYLAGYFPLDATPDEATLVAQWKAGKYALWAHIIDPRMPVSEKARRGWDFVGKSLSHPTIMTTGSVISTLNGVCAQSKHADKAVEYLNLINSDTELYNLLSFGIEGKHWVWVDQAKNLIGPANGSDWSTVGYHPNTEWMWGNNFNAYYTDASDADNQLWQQVKALNDSALKSVALGFSYDRANTQTEIANVNSAVDEYCGPVSVGSSDDLQTCIDKVKEAGIDTIIADMQEQLDAFRASKSASP